MGTVSRGRPVNACPCKAPSDGSRPSHPGQGGRCHLSPCWKRGGPGGTSWLGSTGGSGVSVSNCSRLIMLTFLKFSTSCCRGYEIGVGQRGRDAGKKTALACLGIKTCKKLKRAAPATTYMEFWSLGSQLPRHYASTPGTQAWVC